MRATGQYEEGGRQSTGLERGSLCTRRALLRRGLGLAAGTAAASVLDVAGVRLAPARALTGAPLTVGGNPCVFWNNVALEAIRLTRPGPPMVARQIAMLNTCMFDAWAAYHYRAVGTRLGGKLRRPPDERTAANKAQAVSFASITARSRWPRIVCNVAAHGGCGCVKPNAVTNSRS